MKRITSLVLAAIIAASALASCNTPTVPASTSSSVYADRAWLESRLGEVPDSVTVGTADSLGIDMTDFEDDGYVIRSNSGEVILCGKTEVGRDRAVRRYAKAVEAGRDVEDTTYHEGYRIDRLTVAGCDISEYKLVYEGESDSPGTEHNNAYFAACEMKRLISKACGAELEITDTDCAKMIRIGYLTDGKHGENGFVYRVENGNIHIDGVGKANGCAAGVYYFLQEECGWDELIYGDSDLREADHLDIPDGTCADVDPMFDYCLPNPNQIRPFRNDHDLYRGYTCYASHGQLTYKWGGYDVTSKQLCYTDESVMTGVTEDILYYLETRRDSGIETRYVDIAQGDNATFCTCRNCIKAYREENMSNAGAIVRYANTLCEAMADDGFPDTVVAIFAYLGTNIPPKTHPHEMVSVTYCTDHSCGIHRCDGSDPDCDLTTTFCGAMGSAHYGNKDFGEWMRGWAELTDRLYIWHYGLDLYGHELTQDYNFYYDFMFFREIGVCGLYYQNECNGLGEGQLRLEQMMYLQYHPDATEAEYDAAVRDIYDREFGDGGGYALAYTKNIWSRTQLAAGCSGFWIWDIIEPSAFDYETFRATEDEAMRLLDEAIKLADSLDQEKSAKKFSCDLLYKVCWMNYFRAYDRDDKAELERLDGIYGLFVSRMADAGVPLQHKKYLNDYYDSHPMQSKLEDAAWIDWQSFRDELTDEGAEKRPCPEKYEGIELPPRESRAW